MPLRLSLQSDGKEVAVKVVRKSKLRPDEVMNLLVEVEVLRGIDHPAVIK